MSSMDDEDDVQKLTELLDKHKTGEENNFQVEFEEFVNFNLSDEEDVEEELVDYEEELGEVDPVDTSKLHSFVTTNSLKAEERAVIEKCQDRELKRLLVLNRSKNMTLIRFYKKIKDLLIECQNNIEVTTMYFKNMAGIKHTGNCLTGIWKLAAPYFKDEELYSCRPNNDVFRKKKNKEISIYDVVPSTRWSTIECKNLVIAVQMNYNINRQKEVNKKISEARNNSLDTKKDIEEHKQDLSKLEEQFKKLQELGDEDVPPVNSDKYIDWERVSEIFLKERHTSSECRAFWHIYLHPEINKSNWTDEENIQIKSVATKYNLQDWDNIAKDLGTNRSGFATCLHYYSNLITKFRKDKFTPEEDEMLLELVNFYKMANYIPWAKVAYHFKDRTRPQLFHRYTYFLAQNHVTRGKFTEAEDVLIMLLVDKFGRNFSKCARYMPHRSLVQLKARYSSNLHNIIRKGSFTEEEDQVILDHVNERGSKCWAELTNRMQRCRGQLRQRYLILRQYFDENPKGTLKDAPRRKHIRLEKDQDTYQFLRYIADQFKGRNNIPSLEEIERVLGNTAKGSEDTKQKEVLEPEMNKVVSPDDHLDHLLLSKNQDVEELLIEFFNNSFKLNTNHKLVTSGNLQEAVTSTDIILRQFGAKLELPPDFDQSPHIDNLDIAILINLTERENSNVVIKPSEPNLTKVTVPRIDISMLVPPNINTLVGLRSLIIKYKSFKAKTKLVTTDTQIFDSLHPKVSYSHVIWCIEHFLTQLKEPIKSVVLAERELFYKRFYALFKWASILTLQEPHENLMSTPVDQTRPLAPQYTVNRTYSRKRNNAEAQSGETIVEKKAKILNEIASSTCIDLPLPTETIYLPSVSENDNTEFLELNEVPMPENSETVPSRTENLLGTVTYINKSDFSELSEAHMPETSEITTNQPAKSVKVKSFFNNSEYSKLDVLHPRTKKTVIQGQRKNSLKLIPMSNNHGNSLVEGQGKTKLLCIDKTTNPLNKPGRVCKPVPKAPPYAKKITIVPVPIATKNTVTVEDLNATKEINIIKRSTLNKVDLNEDMEDVKKLDKFLKNEVKVETDEILEFDE